MFESSNSDSDSDPESSGHNHGFSNHTNEEDLSDDDCLGTLLHENLVTGENIVLPIYARTQFHVGREVACGFTIKDMLVSNQHFRIYSVIYEMDQLDKYPPLIYCEDLESRNGTYVNDLLIGIYGNERIGRLLVDGDLIEIRPHWRFRFRQPKSFPTSFNRLPRNEVEYFKERFTISNRILGSGSAGDVFVAHEIGTLKQLACKVIKRRKFNTGSARMRISERDNVEEENKPQLRELEILMKLNHPNIINIQKAFISDDRLYMFTELATAGDLYAYFESYNCRLEDVHARLITRQIALALEYIHSKGIAHRDIKMENILLTNMDVGSRIILTDFGLANYVDHRTGRMFSAVGTEGYAAPEIWGVGSNRGYTLAADMWSFGMLAWTLLTGEIMVPRGTLSRLEATQIARDFVSLDEESAAHKWSYLSSRVRDFLRRLMATEPGRRMTAAQTVVHSWYKKPSREAKAMEDAYGRVTKFWRPREASEETLEYLSNCTSLVKEVLVSNNRKRLPDASSSPYFSLNRHLVSRSPSKRQKVLEELNKSGAPFIIPEPHQKGRSSKNDMSSSTLPRVPAISGKDIFGNSIESQIELAENNSDNCGSIGNAASGTASSRSKRMRRETDPEEQQVHDAASKTLPKYCSAKFYKDQISEIKKQKAERV